MEKKFCDLIFYFVCQIEPIRTNEGDYLKNFPQSRYNNIKNIRLNNYGEGPFCNFKIPTCFDEGGVYALFENHELKYIGECQNLSSRFNNGYGNISPRNCFIGGQETNCRINNLVLCSSQKGGKITLWFYKSISRKEIELNLRLLTSPEWNRN